MDQLENPKSGERVTRVYGASQGTRKNAGILPVVPRQARVVRILRSGGTYFCRK